MALVAVVLTAVLILAETMYPEFLLLRQAYSAHKALEAVIRANRVGIGVVFQGQHFESAGNRSGADPRPLGRTADLCR